jgi:hypothetical protein
MVGIFSVVSWIALPQVSQFVGFDASATDPTTQAYSAALRANSVVPAEPSAVVPASLRMDDSAAMPKVNRVRARVSPEKQIAPPLRVRFNPGRMRRSAQSGQIVASGFAMNSASNTGASGGDEEFVPQFQTLVLIETTQYGNSSAQFWSVQVWHVTLLRAKRERMIRVPVASSI